MNKFRIKNKHLKTTTYWGAGVPVTSEAEAAVLDDFSAAKMVLKMLPEHADRSPSAYSRENWGIEFYDTMKDGWVMSDDL